MSFGSTIGTRWFIGAYKSLPSWSVPNRTVDACVMDPNLKARGILTTSRAYAFIAISGRTHSPICALLMRLGRPSQRATVRLQGSGHRGSIVPSPADQHHAKFGYLPFGSDVECFHQRCDLWEYCDNLYCQNKSLFNPACPLSNIVSKTRDPQNTLFYMT